MSPVTVRNCHIIAPHPYKGDAMIKATKHETLVQNAILTPRDDRVEKIIQRAVQTRSRRVVRRVVRVLGVALLGIVFAGVVSR